MEQFLSRATTTLKTQNMMNGQFPFVYLGNSTFLSKSTKLYLMLENVFTCSKWRDTVLKTTVTSFDKALDKKKKNPGGILLCDSNCENVTDEQTL